MKPSRPWLQLPDDLAGQVRSCGNRSHSSYWAVIGLSWSLARAKISLCALTCTLPLFGSSSSSGLARIRSAQPTAHRSIIELEDDSIAGFAFPVIRKLLRQRLSPTPQTRIASARTVPMRKVSLAPSFSRPSCVFDPVAKMAGQGSETADRVAAGRWQLPSGGRSNNVSTDPERANLCHPNHLNYLPTPFGPRSGFIISRRERSSVSSSGNAGKRVFPTG